MRIVKIALVLSLISTALVASLPSHGMATNGFQSSWAPDKRVPGYLDDTFTPFLIADQNRTVHAFATQWAGKGEDRKRAIFYRQWALTGGWTRPIDILLSPTGDAQILGGFLSADGVLHVIFWGGAAGGNAGVYYSTALASEADIASAWSLPELIGEMALFPTSGIINGDDQGNLIVVYNGNKDGNGLYAIVSGDDGHSWSIATPIFLTNDRLTIPYNIKSSIAEPDALHVVWGVNVIEGALYDSLYYSRIDFGTGDWTQPQLLDKRPNIVGYFGPSVPSVVETSNRVVLMYNGGNPFAEGIVPLGRPTILVRLSENGGETWGSVSTPLPFLIGQSAEQALVVDSNQVAHLIAVMRIDALVEGEYKPVGGIWHSEFADGVWRYPERLVTTISPVNIRAVVSQGNVILATWMTDIGAGQHGVWFSYRILDVPELPVVALPTLQIADRDSPRLATTEIIVESTPAEDVIEAPLSLERSYMSNLQFPILISVVPVVALIVGIIAWTVATRRKF